MDEKEIIYEKKKEALTKEYKKDLLKIQNQPGNEKKKKRLDRRYALKLTVLRLNFQKKVLKSIKNKRQKLFFQKALIHIMKFRNNLYDRFDSYPAFLTFLPRMIVTIFVLAARIFSWSAFVTMIPTELKRLWSQFSSRILNLYRPSRSDKKITLMPGDYRKNIRQINEKLKGYMDKSASRLAREIEEFEGKTFLDALKHLNQHDYLIKDMRYLTKSDIIGQEISSGLLDMDIGQILKKPITIGDIRTDEILRLMVQNDVPIVLFEQRWISSSDIMRIFCEFHKHYSTLNLKRANELCKKAKALKKNEKVMFARKTMAEKDCAVILVFDEQEPVGIFTKDDYINEISKGIERVRRYELGQVMQTSYQKIKPYSTILEANDQFIESGSMVVGNSRNVFGYLDDQLILKYLLDFYDTVQKDI